MKKVQDELSDHKTGKMLTPAMDGRREQFAQQMRAQESPAESHFCASDYKRHEESSG